MYLFAVKNLSATLFDRARGFVGRENEFLYEELG